MVRQKQLLPGFAVPYAIARALAARDPGFLDALRANARELLALQPEQSATRETLAIFLTGLDDRRIFPPR